MTSLQTLCALPIEIENCDNDFKLRLSKEIHCTCKRTILLENLVPALLNRSIKYPKKVYEEYSICLKEDCCIFNTDLKYDLLVIPPGLLGIEFIKSHTYFSPESSLRNRVRFSSIVEAINATITIIMQKVSYMHERNDNPMIEEGIMVELHPGEKFAIPEGYYYTFINTTEEPAILSRLYKSANEIDYNAPEHKHTMGYFCIRKNARQELVYNPKFRNIPAIKHISRKETMTATIGLTIEEPLYMLAKAKTEMLLDILK